MTETDNVSKKKEDANCEIRPELSNLKLLYAIYAFLIIAAIIMPQYFGIHIGVDITCTRFANIMIMCYMIFNPKILSHFVKTSLRCEIIVPLMLYLFVASYTMVLRVDINAFFMVFIEILTLFMLIYGIRYVVGYKRAIRWIIGCAYFLACYGLIEYVYGGSIFLKFLSTVPNTVSNAYRSGHYRIMGPCGHALGYGLVLILFVAVSCIDLKKNEIYLFKRPILLILLLLNVFLTGSRSTLGIVVIELFIILLISNSRNIKKSLIMIFGLLVCFLIFILLFNGTDIGQYVLGQIASVIDEVAGTEFAAKFGVETERLQDSASYREALPYIFKPDWLNPLVGRGRGFGGAEINGVFIHSIDNYYVAQYIKFAYPGLFAYAIFLIVLAIVLCRDVFKRKSVISKLVLIGAAFYFINLWWVDALQTLKYVYIIIAVFYAYRLEKEDAVKYKNLNILKS